MKDFLPDVEDVVGNVLLALLPFIIGSAVVPIQIMIGILLLKSPQQGRLKAIAFVGGMTLARILQGILFGFVLAEAVHLDNQSGTKPIISTLLLVLGILLLVAAYKKWSGSEDLDEPPPKWLTALDGVTPLKALGIGFGFPVISVKLWVFTLSAIVTIAAADLGQPTNAIAYLLFILLAQSLLLLPILYCLLRPKRSKARMKKLSDWLATYNRPISMIVSLIFGLFFLYSGISGLRA